MNGTLRYFHLVICLLISTGLLAFSSDFPHENPTLAKLKAQELQQNMLVYFSADWCLPCQLMEDHVLKDPVLAQKMKQNFITINASFDETDDKEWFDSYAVTCLPTLSVINKEGKELDRLEGYVNLVTLHDMLDKYLTNEVILDIAEESEALVDPTLLINRQVKIADEGPELLTEAELDNNFFNEVSIDETKKTNPPTLIGIKDGVLEDQNSFYNVKVSKANKETVPPAVNLKELANAPSRGTDNFGSASKSVVSRPIENDHSVTTATTSKTPLRTPITGKIISTKRSNVGIQFGAFGSYSNALKLTEALASEEIETIILEQPVGDKMLFKVLKLGVHSMTQAKKDIENYNRQGIKCFLKLL